MPVYRYINLKTSEEFEVIQTMSEPRLEKHPETGDPVRRIILAPNLNIKHTPGRMKGMLDPKNIAAKGFTRYEKSGDGHYVRTAGDQGPAEFRSK